MKKVLKWTGIIVLALIAIMMIYAFQGKDETHNLKIQTVSLSQISDGNYLGSYDSFRWSNSVEVTVKDHIISSIKVIRPPNNRDVSKALIDKVIKEQTPAVDVGSGASIDGKAFLKSVETALKSGVK